MHNEGFREGIDYVPRKIVGPVVGKVGVVYDDNKGGDKNSQSAPIPNFETGGSPSGPISGLVSARILLETDSPATITLVAINVLTGSRHLVSRTVPGRLPFVLVLTGLQQGRRYRCEWFGFEMGAQCRFDR